MFSLTSWMHFSFFYACQNVTSICFRCISICGRITLTQTHARTHTENWLYFQCELNICGRKCKTLDHWVFDSIYIYIPFHLHYDSVCLSFFFDFTFFLSNEPHTCIVFWWIQRMSMMYMLHQTNVTLYAQMVFSVHWCFIHLYRIQFNEKCILALKIVVVCAFHTFQFSFVFCIFGDVVENPFARHTHTPSIHMLLFRREIGRLSFYLFIRLRQWFSKSNFQNRNMKLTHSRSKMF